MNFVYKIIVLITIGGLAFAAPLSGDSLSADSSQNENILTERPELLRPIAPVEKQIVPWRVGAYCGLATGIFGFAYSRMDDWWGDAHVPFHIKHDDWSGDNLAQTDEVSHCLVSYKIAQVATDLAKWSGFRDGTSRIIGGCLAGGIITFVEYPVDAHNPYQGFGYTDMIANAIGIGLALSRDRWPEYLERVDLRISIKSTDGISNEIIAKNMAQNDNYTYWLVVNPVEDFPVHAALGYSANHDSPDHIVDREIYLGFGTSIAELAGLIDKDWKRKLDLFNVYELSFSFRVD